MKFKFLAFISWSLSILSFPSHSLILDLYGFARAAIASLPSSQLLHHTQLTSGLALTNNMVHHHHHHNSLMSNGLAIMSSNNNNNNNNNNSINANNNLTNNNNNSSNNNNNSASSNHLNHHHHHHLHNENKKGILSSNNSSSNSIPASSPNHISRVLTPGKIPTSHCMLLSRPYFPASPIRHFEINQIDVRTPLERARKKIFKKY